MKRKKPFYLVRAVAPFGVCLPYTEIFKSVPAANEWIAKAKAIDTTIGWHYISYTILRCVPVRKGARR